MRSLISCSVAHLVDALRESRLVWPCQQEVDRLFPELLPPFRLFPLPPLLPLFALFSSCPLLNRVHLLTIVLWYATLKHLIYGGWELFFVPSREYSHCGSPLSPRTKPRSASKASICESLSFEQASLTQSHSDGENMSNSTMQATGLSSLVERRTSNLVWTLGL